MTQFKQYSIIFLVLLSIFFTIFLLFSQNKFQEEQNNFKNFRDKSKALVSLSKKWGENKNYKKIFVRLRAISRPKKEIAKGHIKIFDFENLSQVHLERIMNILFNSNFNIKEFNVQKNNDKVSLHVEVKL